MCLLESLNWECLHSSAKECERPSGGGEEINLRFSHLFKLLFIYPPSRIYCCPPLFVRGSGWKFSESLRRMRASNATVSAGSKEDTVCGVQS